MVQYEYKVIPTPTKGRKGPGLKGPEARFAFAIQEHMNELAAEGWMYLRSDLLPSEERSGLTSSQTIYRSVLVFRREVAEGLPDIFSQPEPEADTSEPLEASSTEPVDEMDQTEATETTDQPPEYDSNTPKPV